MCTLALYFRVFDSHPLIVAANRDEHYDRPSVAPHLWPTRPAVFAGKDLLAGGTWFGVNQHGLVAGILNRRPRGKEAPPAPSRSRGLLCLDLLGLRTAAEASAFVQSHKDRYQPFTVLFADLEQAWVASDTGEGVAAVRLSEGLHVLSNTGDFNTQSEKVSRAYHRFAQLGDTLRSEFPGPSELPRAFASVLADHTVGTGAEDPKDAICVHAGISGTVSSILTLYSRADRQFKTFFCPGPPCRNSFGDAVALAVR
ncbi:MAG TPA: NRDE family protein [Candidatus Binatia bacterium]|nr:NRDE family protein [Candidatus Binatia bacterium]